MLLRRVIEHVKAQNWTAVGLDFVIVVLGVFIGIQVSNWNDARADKTEEARILERLHDEVLALTNAREPRSTDRRQILRDFHSATRVLFKLEDRAQLTNAECLGVMFSHVYVGPPDTLPIIDDLISTGRMDLITDEKIRQALANFVRERDEGRNTLAAVNEEIYRLAIRHPGLISRRLVKKAGQQNGLTFSNTCDTPAMQENTAFLNEVLDNEGRYRSYIESVFNDVDPALAALLAEIEDVLPAHDHGTVE